MIHCHTFSSKTMTPRDLSEAFLVLTVLLRCYVQSGSYVGLFEGIYCLRCSSFSRVQRFLSGFV